MDLSKSINTLKESLDSYIGHFTAATHTDNSQSNSRAESLTVKSIRRYMDETEIPLDRDLTLIYAPNGVGKSSLVDALDLLVHEETMRRRHSSFNRAETKDDTALPSWNSSPKDMGIRLDFEDGRSLSYGSLVLEDDLRPVCSPENTYRTISRYSVRQPLQGSKTDRFRQIFSILQLEGLQERTEELNSTYSGLQAEIKYIDQLKDRILAILPTGMKPVALEPFIETTEDTGTQAQRNQLLQEEQEIISDLATLFSLSQSVSELDLTFSDQEPIKPETEPPPLREGELGAIQTLRRIVHKGELCPFCSSTELTGEVLQLVSELLERNAAWVSYEDAVALFTRKKEQWLSTVQRLNEYRSAVEDLALNEVNQQRYIELQAKSLQKLNPLVDLPTVERVQSELLELIKLHEADSEQKKKTTEDQLAALMPENAEAIQQALGLLGITPEERRKNLSLINAVSSLQEQLKDWKKKFDVAQKKIATDAIEPIRNEIMQWWELMAPSRTGFHIEIEINPSGTTPSININCIPYSVVSSAKKGLKDYSKPATGHLSDSQLDILALSIMFASHKRQFGKGFLWMDDPSDMFDEDTRQNFFDKAVPKLINEGIQVVIATHSRSIVEECWSALGKAHKHDDLQTNDFGRSFRQINLDIENMENDADLELSKVVLSPFDSESARKHLDTIHTEVKQGQNQWIIGQRLRFASAIRRYAEFILAELAYASNKLLIGDNPTSIRLVGDSTATLRDFYNDCQDLLQRLHAISSNLEFEEPALQHAHRVIDLMLSTLSTLNIKPLNEGSHAAATIPTYKELCAVLNTLDRLVKPGHFDRSEDFPIINKLKAVYPEGAHRKGWETAIEASRRERIPVK